MPVARQIVALVAGALVLATAIFFAVTFAGPPPRPAPVPLASVAKSLAGSTARGPAMITIAESTAAPTGRTGDNPNPAADAIVARTLGVSRQYIRGFYANDVRGLGDGPLSPDTAELRGSFTVGLKTGNNWRIASAPDAPMLTQWHAVTLGAMGLTLIVLILLATRIARAIAAPLADLARAADATSASPEDPPIPRRGPPEVQRVANALADMRDRLTTTLSARTDLLVGIAHDLGTPLMRLALRAEVLPPDTRTAALADIEEMRSMTRAVLDFARGVPVDRQRIDLCPLLEKLVDDMNEAGAKATLVAPQAVLVDGDAFALRRLVGNLIDNATRYAGPSTVALSSNGTTARVTVTDNGPGFDPAIAEQLFEPFVRGERSRSRATGGTGLGLAIARRIAGAHGGALTASLRPEGGACFELRLPLSG